MANHEAKRAVVLLPVPRPSVTHHHAISQQGAFSLLCRTRRTARAAQTPLLTMPTCRTCGRIGPKTCNCPVVPVSHNPQIQALIRHPPKESADDVQAGSSAKPSRTPRMAVGRAEAAHDVRALEKNIGDLLHCEAGLYSNTTPHLFVEQ